MSVCQNDNRETLNFVEKIVLKIEGKNGEKFYEKLEEKLLKKLGEN